jgi:PilZ domain-containing protein
MSIHQCDSSRAEWIALGVRVFILIHAQCSKLRYKSQMIDVSWVGSELKTAVTVLPGQTVEILPAQSPLRFVVRGRVVWTDRSVVGVDFLKPLPTDCWSLGAST